MSQKEKCIFFLDPKQDYFRLDRLEFQTKTPEERAQWYLAITKCYKDDEMMQQQYISSKTLYSASVLDSVHGGLEFNTTPRDNKPTLPTGGGNQLLFESQMNFRNDETSTLHEITDYLQKEDAELHSAMSNAERAFQ